MPNSPFTFSTATANIGMNQLASTPAASFGGQASASSGLNFSTNYATSQYLEPSIAITQPMMTVAQIKQRLKDFKKSVSDKLKALKIAWEEFETGLSIDVTTIKQLVTILEEVRQALSLLGELENTLAEFREFIDDYGSYISVPASALKGIAEASAWAVHAHAQFANAENIILSSFSDRHASRVELSVDSALDWDESPTIYQATSIAHGHMLCYRMRLKANGYSLGELLNTFALGPCQKKQISVLEFGREEVASRKEALDATESLESSLSRDRDVSEVLSASVSEKIKGKSRSTSAGWSGGTGISGSGSGQKGPLKGAVGATSGFMGSIGISGARSSQKSSRKIAASSMQRLRERINQSASAVRSQRATVVESVSQTERVSAVTEVIANKNMCHSMNFMFFEVLKHFVIEQALVDVQEVLYIPLQITPFSPEKILRWQDILFDFVPSSQLRAGFADLAEWQKGNYAPNRLLADESIQDMSGHMVLSFDLPLPEINDPEIEDGDEIPNTHNFGPAWSFYKASRFSLFTRSYYKSYFFRRNFRTRQQVWENQMVPKIVPEFMEELQVWANTPSGAIDLKLDITQLTRFRHGAKMSVKLATTSSTPPIRRSDIQSLEIRSGRQVPSNARILIESASLSYRAESLNGFIFRDTRLQNDIGNSDTARIVTPLNAEEMRNPRKEQERRANILIEHLNSNREVYHEILFKEMDEHRRFMLLDGIRLPSAGNRSVANLVENRVVEVVGNSMVMPVAQGLRIDPIFHEITDLFEFYSPLDDPEPFRMSLPTGGYFMEAVMGTCNSCEDLDYTKARFNGFACEDEPSAIEPISMDSRRAAPSDLQAKDFAAPIVAFQNVPNAPDPTGLGAAMQVLGNSDTFRDATGLAATQANAMAALAKTADGAEAMANISADLTKQAFAGIADVTVDRDLARIQDQLDKGNISEDDAKGMIKDVLGNKAQSTQAPSDDSSTKNSSLLENPNISERISDGGNISYSNGSEEFELTDTGYGLSNTNYLDQLKKELDDNFMYDGGGGDQLCETVFINDGVEYAVEVKIEDRNLNADKKTNHKYRGFSVHIKNRDNGISARAFVIARLNRGNYRYFGEKPILDLQFITSQVELDEFDFETSSFKKASKLAYKPKTSKSKNVPDTFPSPTELFKELYSDGCIAETDLKTSESITYPRELIIKVKGQPEPKDGVILFVSLGAIKEVAKSYNVKKMNLNDEVVSIEMPQENFDQFTNILNNIQTRDIRTITDFWKPTENSEVLNKNTERTPELNKLLSNPQSYFVSEDDAKTNTNIVEGTDAQALGNIIAYNDTLNQYTYRLAQPYRFINELRINFVSNGDTISATGLQGGQSEFDEVSLQLESLVAFLSYFPDIRVEITGHTDTVGSDQDNIALGQRRADSVRDYLVAKGLTTSRITTNSVGEAFCTGTDMAACRKVTFVFSNI